MSPSLLAGALFLTGAHDARAAVVYDSGGFEPPRFVVTPGLNNLDGQDAAPVGQGPWDQDAGTSTAVVQTNFPNGGLQSVRVQRDGSATGDTRWGVALPTPLVGIVTVDVDVRVSVAPLTIGPLFGIEAHDDSSGGAKLLGGVTLDASTGDVLYRQAGTGSWRPTGTFLDRNSYQHLAISADFVTNTYSVFANGNLLRTEGFVNNTASALTHAPIVALAAGAAAPETGTAYFDNFTISQVPEPGTVSLLACGAGLCLKRRRRA